MGLDGYLRHVGYGVLSCNLHQYQDVLLTVVVLHVGIEVEVGADRIAWLLLIESEERMDQIGIGGEDTQLR